MTDGIEVYTSEDKRKVLKMYCDMYEGQDVENLSITTRLTLMEKIVATYQKILWVCASTLVALIVKIIFDVVKSH